MDSSPGYILVLGLTLHSFFLLHQITRDFTASESANLGRMLENLELSAHCFSHVRGEQPWHSFSPPVGSRRSNFNGIPPLSCPLADGSRVLRCGSLSGAVASSPLINLQLTRIGDPLNAGRSPYFPRYLAPPQPMQQCQKRLGLWRHCPQPLGFSNNIRQLW